MKERIKSFVLVVLVIVNFILGSKVLSTEKLWSGDGYNFFVTGLKNPITDFFRNIKSHFNGSRPIETHLEAPELIIVNTGYQTSRRILVNNDSEFSVILEIASDFLRSAFSDKQQFAVIPKDEFYSALTAKSIYLRYSTEYDAALYSHILGATRTDFSGLFSQLRNIVISSEGYVYVEDSDTGAVYCCYTHNDTLALNEIIDSRSSDEYSDTPVINYAFDLGFDKSFATQKTVLSPMIPIFSDSFEVEAVSVSRPLSSADSSYNDAAVTAILPLFNMNPNSFRRYTEVDGTVVFVENNATLKISPDGCLSYTANDNGISLSPASLTPTYDTVTAVADFVDSINRAANSSAIMQLSSKLTSSELSASEYKITLDYTANGRRVKLDSGNSEPAVTATISDNRLIAYRHHIRSFAPTGDYSQVENYIFALDDAIANFQNQITDIEISELNIIYEDNFTDTILAPCWNVEVKEIIIG